MIFTDRDLHVWHSPYGWKASSHAGDFGIGPTRNKAVEIAEETSRTLGLRIHLHDISGRVVKTIGPVRGAPVPQWFQDDVP